MISAFAARRPVLWTALASGGKRVVAIGHPRRETLAALHEWKRDPTVRALRLSECLTPPFSGFGLGQSVLP